MRLGLEHSIVCGGVVVGRGRDGGMGRGDG